MSDIVVIGDVIVDDTHICETTRLDANAPVMVAKQIHRYVSLGGAGNVAQALAAQGNNVRLLCAGGVDDDSSFGPSLTTALVRACHKYPLLHTAPPLIQPGYATTRKIRARDTAWRLISRMDIEGGTLQAAARERYVQAHFGHPDMLVVVDYNKGMCTGMLPWLLERSASLKVLAPKPSNVTQRMPGISLVSCNLAEATDIVGPALIARLALNLRWHCAAEHVIITDGQRGVFGSGPQYEYVANSNGNAAVDATGAGDIVVAAAAHGLLHQYSPAKRLEWAAACADAYVSDPCAWANNPLDAFKVLGSKHPHYKQLDMRWLLQLKRGADNCGIKRRLGATCGVFDVLHDGHIRFLHDATAGANFLVVFINSDASVRRLKGEGRPIMTVEQRVAALSALPFVHAVVVFDGDSPAEHLVALRPDAFYKGPTTEEPIPEEAALNAVGCLVIKMPVLRSNESTTQIIQRSAECQKANEQTPAGNG